MGHALGKAFVFAVLAILSGCAVQRAQVAHEAQDKMVGLTKERVLACMGVPATKAVEGTTEVWSYNSGDGTVIASTFGNSTTNATVSGGPNYATGQANRFGSTSGVSRSRFCTVNVVMTGGVVSKVNYAGPTGGPLTAGEQCAFAVQNCVQ
jgi:hypothetical protein